MSTASRSWFPSSRSTTSTATATSLCRRRPTFCRVRRSTSRRRASRSCSGTSTATATDDSTSKSSPGSTPKPEPRKHRAGGRVTIGWAERTKSRGPRVPGHFFIRFADLELCGAQKMRLAAGLSLDPLGEL